MASAGLHTSSKVVKALLKLLKFGDGRCVVSGPEPIGLLALLRCLVFEVDTSPSEVVNKLPTAV